MEEILDNEIRYIRCTVIENHNIEVEEGEEIIEEPDTKILSEEMKTIDDTYTTRYGWESRTESTYVPEIGGKKYTYNHAQFAAYMMQQSSLKEGLKKFGEKRDKAVYDEMEQQNLREAFRPVSSSDLTPEKKK